MQNHCGQMFKFGLLILFTVLSASSKGQNSDYVRSGGVEIYYRDYGEGIPVVLLSGGPGQSSDVLLPIVEKLKGKYRVILVDQRGTGKSTLETIDSTTITLDNYVEDINNVRKYLNIEDWAVIGHSWGGGLAMALTAKYPHHTSKLILVGSIGIDSDFLDYVWDNLRYTKDDLESLSYWSDANVRAKNPERAAYEWYSTLLPSRLYNLAKKREILKNYVIEPNSLDIGPLMFRQLAANGYDFKPELEYFNKPTLIIQGRQGFLGGWTAFTIYQTIPDCEIKFIEKCGHFPFIERSEQFYEALETFLEY
jgi:proline iminopeptidase